MASEVYSNLNQGALNVKDIVKEIYILLCGIIALQQVLSQQKQQLKF